jgi:hypothetical protein
MLSMHTFHRVFRERYPRPVIRLVKFDYISLADEIRLLKAFGITGSLGH